MDKMNELINELSESMAFLRHHHTAIVIHDMIEEMLDTRLELKVLRTGEAKRFPLLHFKKEGDVGLDIPCVLPIKKEYMDDPDGWRQRFIQDAIMGPQEIEDELHETVVVQPGQVVNIPSGIRLEIPAGYWIELKSRSSTGKLKLLKPDAIIDNGYRGEIFGVLMNMNNEPIEIKHGERYIQAIIHKMYTNIDITEVDELSPSERGETGFGSTGGNALLDR